MAQFTKVNGDYLPVINMDSGSYTNSGLNAVESGVTVQPQGPKLQYFTVTAAGALTGTQVNVLVQTIQQKATVYIYEYVNDANDTLSFASYPTGAWTAAALDLAFTAAGVAATTTSDGASFSG